MRDDIIQVSDDKAHPPSLKDSIRKESIRSEGKMPVHCSLPPTSYHQLELKLEGQCVALGISR